MEGPGLLDRRMFDPGLQRYIPTGCIGLLFRFLRPSGAVRLSGQNVWRWDIDIPGQLVVLVAVSVLCG